MTAKVQVRIKDASDEYTGVGFRHADIDDVTVTFSDVETFAGTLVGHIEAHSLGTVAQVYASQDTQARDETRPSDNFAQRELGYRFYYTDNTTQESGSFTIGTADLDIASYLPGSDALDLTASPTAAMVTFLEANVLSRDGNAITIDRAIVVGRNS